MNLTGHMRAFIHVGYRVPRTRFDGWNLCSASIMGWSLLAARSIFRFEERCHPLIHPRRKPQATEANKRGEDIEKGRLVHNCGGGVHVSRVP